MASMTPVGFMSAAAGGGRNAGLCACGFRLAGSEPLPAILARPYLSVKDPYTDFAREFEHAAEELRSADAADSRKIRRRPSK